MHTYLFAENEIFILHNSLYTHMLPFLKKSCLSVDCGTIIADIAATFTVLSSIPAFSDTKVLLFNFFVVNQGIGIKWVLLITYKLFVILNWFSTANDDF